ncbi:MAG: response regulator, partial [Magnetospirillum sp.]|nr:response regulator [Magnetospirillum sp.]
VLKALEDYAVYHFDREERVLAACAYPGLTSHSAFHRRMAEEVRQLKSRYDADRSTVQARDFLAFLNRWLIEHICSTDMDYRTSVVGHDAAVAAAAEVTMTPSRPGSNGLDWSSLKVLVVDDNRTFCKLLCTILEGVGVTASKVAHDLPTAKAAAEATRPDVVLVDWRVGREDGLDLVRWLRTPPLPIPPPTVVVLSGYEEARASTAALAAGADAFLEKPVSARVLLVSVAGLLAEKSKPPSR